MKSRGDIFDFTSGEGPSKVQDPVRAIEMAAQVFCTRFRPEHLAPQSGADVDAYLDDFLSTIRNLGPDLDRDATAGTPDPEGWSRWIATVRTSVRDVLGVFRSLLADHGDVGSSVALPGFARMLVEVIRWDLVGKQVPDPEIWAQLGTLFIDATAARVTRGGGGGSGLAQEYLRAIAYHSVALDQLSFPACIAACRVVDLCLPFLTLQPGVSPVALYLVNPPAAPVPVRASRATAALGWSYVPGAAVEFLAELHGQLLRGGVPPALAGSDPGLLCDAAAHLRRLWSHRPPVRRFRRHLVNEELLVVRGYEAVRCLFVAAGEVDNRGWQITDLSRGGVGALVIRGAPDSTPESGDLLAFRPKDGSSWHLGVVRRVRFAKGIAEVGIETLSVRPALIRVDDGRVPVDMFFCDPVLRGEAVRIIAPQGTIRENVPLFITADGKVSKLKPLDGSMVGKGFELRVYQVL